MATCCEHGNEHFVSIKYGKFLIGWENIGFSRRNPCLEPLCVGMSGSWNGWNKLHQKMNKYLQIYTVSYWRRLENSRWDLLYQGPKNVGALPLFSLFVNSIAILIYIYFIFRNLDEELARKTKCLCTYHRQNHNEFDIFMWMWPAFRDISANNSPFTNVYVGVKAGSIMTCLTWPLHCG